MCLGQQRVGNNTATGPGSPLSQCECLANGSRDLAHGFNVEDAFRHGLQESDLIEAVNLEWPELFALCDVADDRNERHRIDQRFTHASQRVGHTWTGHNREHAGLAGRTCVTVGHRAGAELVRAEQIRQRLRLHHVPEFVLLGARDAVNALATFLNQRFDNCLGPGHLPFDPAWRPTKHPRPGGHPGSKQQAAGDGCPLQESSTGQVHDHLKEKLGTPYVSVVRAVRLIPRLRKIPSRL